MVFRGPIDKRAGRRIRHISWRTTTQSEEHSEDAGSTAVFRMTLRRVSRFSCHTGVGLAALAMSLQPAAGLTIDPNPFVSESFDLDGNLTSRSMFRLYEIVDGLPDGAELMVGSPTGDFVSLVFGYSVSFSVGPGVPFIHIGTPLMTAAGRIPGGGIPLASLSRAVSLPGLADGTTFHFASPVESGESTERFFISVGQLEIGDQIFAPGRTSSSILTVVPEPTILAFCLAMFHVFAAQRVRRPTRGCSGRPTRPRVSW